MVIAIKIITAILLIISLPVLVINVYVFIKRMNGDL